MRIAAIYTTNSKSTKKSCQILAEKINGDVKLIPVERARKECVLKYDFIILAASALNGKVQARMKMYISNNMRTLKEKPLGLVICCEENEDRFDETFTEELAGSSSIKSNFGYELNPDEGNYIEKRKTNKLIDRYKKNKESLPTLNIDEINKFAGQINAMIEKRVD